MKGQTQTYRILTLEKFNYIYLGIFVLVMGNLNFWPHVKAIPWIELILRPLIMLSLGIFYLIHMPRNFQRKQVVFGLGVALAFIGDIISTFDSGFLFYVLIACFLLSQICYSFAFYQEGSGWLKKHPYVIVFFILYALLLLSVLWKGLGDLKILSIFYSFILVSMGAFALNRKETVTQKSYILVLSGAILYIIYESLVAINKYSQDLPYEGISIMSIYMIAQYGLVIGFLDNQYSEESIG